ncbi:hypothetical protein CDD82_6337 [Ophiocordyceps australis]|uniref:Peptidase S8/S53 domain-containing protein n=1 Tax=Ophiocordyceps australis TaxID=1399860 RepID=A0A2C5YSN6_9HYPO|nr:hypothetical protein CDD82_6337 [Ophiocordyceps australis]
MRTTLALSLAALAQGPLFASALHDESAPVASSVDPQSIPDSYIIKFRDHVDHHVAETHHKWVQKIHESGEQERLELRKRSLSTADEYRGVKHTFNIGDKFRGYSGHFDKTVVDQLRTHPDVESIEPDSIVTILRPVEAGHETTEGTCNGEREKNSPWGLARVSHRETLNFGNFNSYLYSANGGEGVDAYVIDTGTNIEHVDFGGRAKWGQTIPEGDEDEDGNGHGTHCSGTIAGTKYGVAKKANIYAVKVLRSNGSGTMSDVVKGVEWAVLSHNEQVKAAKDGKRKGFKGSVANMSLGGGKTTVLEAAVNAAVKAGVHFAVAAGNDNRDACDYSPAGASEPLTVGATALDDSRAYFSNYGRCTDIFAPGLSIQSTWIGSKHAVNTISGTSMASPHVCGLLAYYLSLQPSSDSEYAVAPMTPKQLKDNLISVSTKGALSGIPEDTPNKLAWNGGGCGNLSDIWHQGGYKVDKAADGWQMVGEAAEKEIVLVSDKMVKGAKAVGAKADKLTKEIHHLVEKELEDLISTLSE